MHQEHAKELLWRRHLRWTAVLLLCWFGVSFGAVLLARDWRFNLFGSPFGVWIAGQGAMLVFLAIVWLHVRIGAAHDRWIADAPAGE